MIQVICFSRKRPLQLHGYLSSLFDRCPYGIAVGVIVKTDPGFEQAYAEVRDCFPYVHFVEETNFSRDINNLLDRSAGDYVCFGCDDVIFTRTILADDIESLFIDEPDVIGLSFRLGRGFTHGMFGEEVRKPLMRGTENAKWLIWNVEHVLSINDWAYPWEVLGTVYPMQFVKDMLPLIDARNPSQLEERGSRIWQGVTERRSMACYPTARIVVPTINIVQTEFPGNGVVGNSALGTEFLLSCFEHGMRMDTNRFNAHSYESWRIADFFLKRNV